MQKLETYFYRLLSVEATAEETASCVFAKLVFGLVYAECRYSDYYVQHVGIVAPLNIAHQYLV